MGHNLSIYLLRPEVKEPDSVMSEEKLNEGYSPLALRDDLDLEFGAIAYIKRSEPKEPTWRSWVGEVFAFNDAQDPKSQSTSCVIFLSAGSRVFGISFGHAYHAIPKNLVEPDFGLTLALNLVDPTKLRNLVTKTVDLKTRERSTVHAAGGKVPEFALDLDLEWLRIAEGKTQRDDFKAIAGKDAVKLEGFNGRLTELYDTCVDLLSIFERGIPEDWAFANHVRPIGPSDPHFAELEEKLEERLLALNFDNMAILLDYKTIKNGAEHKFIYNRRSFTVDSLDSETLQMGLMDLIKVELENTQKQQEQDEERCRVDIKKIRLKISGVDGEILCDRSILDFIQIELEENDKLYIRIEGKWLTAHADYKKRVEERVERLIKDSPSLGLPVWNYTTHKDENDYNKFVATQKNWLCQDMHNYYPSERYAGVEPSDILTNELHFIHVKKGLDRASIGNLSDQLTGAADLYSNEPEFKAYIRKVFSEKWPSSKFDEQRPMFVAAIGRRSEQTLFGQMLIPRINMLEHAKRVQALGFRFGLVLITLLNHPVRKSKK